MRINIPQSVTSGDAPQNFRQIEIGLKAISQMLFGGLGLDNLQAASVTVERKTGDASLEISVQHQLNRVPTGFIVINRTGFGGIKKGSSSWTNQMAYFFVETTGDSFSVLLL
jgi:hypothetical protein